MFAQPTRVWGTYYGGTGTESGGVNLLGNSVATDASGNVYIAGTTSSNAGISTIGSHQATFGGGANDAYLVKFNSAGVRQWATYYGGTGTEDEAYVTVDANGDVYLTGHTTSSNGISTVGSHQPTSTSSDAFLVKFNSAGVRQWATYYGGPNAEFGRSVGVDGSGNVYMSGMTTSPTTTLVATVGGHQPNYGGSMDAFLVKFNNAGVRQWATYYGGTGLESDGASGNSLAIDIVSGNVYLTGQTSSASNISTVGSYQAIYGGNTDAFLVQFNSAGVRQWGTYYGGPCSSLGSALTVDGGGNVYLAGETDCTSSVSTAGSHQTTFGGGFTDGLLVKFNSAGVRQWATYYGGTSSDYATSVARDAIGNIYIAGITSSTNAISTVGSHQATYGGGSWDVFLVQFNNAGVRQWGTYYGGTGTDQEPSVAFAISGHVYITGETSSASAISTAGSHQPTYGGGAYDSFLVQFDGCSTGAAQPSSISGSISVCSGSTPSYSIATVAGATSYTWTLPGGWTGSSSTNIINTTASATSGNITVSASNACGTSAVQNLSVTVNTIPSSPSAISGLTSKCVGSGASSYSVATIAGATSYNWALPSGWSGASTTNNISATPGSSGLFTVTASNSCGTSAQQTLSVTVNAVPVANAGSSQTITCSTPNVSLSGSGVTTYTWSGPSIVSGGNTSAPTVNLAGTYSLVGSTSGCNSNTATVVVITSTTAPTVSIGSSTTTICSGSSVTLTASGAGTYTWSTSSNATSIVVSPGSSQTYTVNGTNTSNGCTASTTQVITVNSTPTVSVAGGAICPGNSFTLSPSGASTYTFSSGPVVSPSSTTSYSVTGTSVAGCVSAGPAIATVTVASSLTVSISGSSSVCNGNPLNLTAGGATTYTWNTGATTGSIAPTPSVNTTYSVIGASGSCSNTAVFSVTVNPTPTVSAVTSSSLICTGQSATLTASGASTYTFNPGGTGSSIVVSPTSTAVYTVTGTDANGCTNTTAITQNVSACTGVVSISQVEKLSIYPNPTNGVLTITKDGSDIGKIEVYNSLGSLIYSANVTDTKTQIDLTQHANGIYFVRIGTTTKRTIKQ
jgi:hypothetical protein